jgi:hypothetical protein
MERISGCRSWMARGIAFILAGLLALSLPLSILANNTLRKIFSPDEIGDAIGNLLLLNQDFNGQMLDNVVSGSGDNLISGSNSSSLANLSPDDQAEVAEILFPENWLRTQIDLNVNNFIAWIESEESSPMLVLDLEPLRLELRQGGSFRIAEIWIDSLPLCTDEQERRLTEAWQQSDEIEFSLCKPSGEVHQWLMDRANQQLLQMIESMPGEISLLDEMDSNEFTKGLDEFRRNILGLLLVMRWIRILPFFLMGLIMTFTIRSWAHMRKWWGIPIGLGALITLAVILLVNILGPGMLKNTLVQSAQPQDLQESIVNVYWGLISSILNLSTFHAFILIIILLFIFTIPILLQKKDGDSTREPPSDVSPWVSAEELPPPPQVEPFQPETFAEPPTNDPSIGNVD